MNAIEMRMMIDTMLENMVDVETGEVKTEDEVLAMAEQVEAEKLEKVEAILKWVGEEKYKIESMKEHKRDLDKRIKVKENLVDRLSKYAAMALDYQKYETPDGLAKISYKKTANVVKVDDITSIPTEFFKTPITESNLCKTDLKSAILAGFNVPGVHLEDTTSIIIRG